MDLMVRLISHQPYEWPGVIGVAWLMLASFVLIFWAGLKNTSLMAAVALQVMAAVCALIGLVVEQAYEGDEMNYTFLKWCGVCGVLIASTLLVEYLRVKRGWWDDEQAYTSQSS